jgi:ribosome modulation factor
MMRFTAAHFRSLLDQIQLESIALTEAPRSNAYRTGQRDGRANYPREECPYHTEDAAREWDAGWADGHKKTGSTKQPKPSRRETARNEDS